ncbi:uncharacterized protein B0H18DRAFT_7372 [Fomitopsis serialis]|uniref:uncharacterized protein n=1 Tax=Fomitopsis serialis TaxID=139415 RepID=UPI00200750F7|nr:uncharacterized protein B0H18DRAFT_7372 [Neoantrodia serialis]KAH9938227.1 hypothetical protein B0H18DRAFT_7372 [Neoantrodia serialis]
MYSPFLRSWIPHLTPKGKDSPSHALPTVGQFPLCQGPSVYGALFDNAVPEQSRVHHGRYRGEGEDPSLLALLDARSFPAHDVALLAAWRCGSTLEGAKVPTKNRTKTAVLASTRMRGTGWMLTH